MKGIVDYWYMSFPEWTIFHYDVIERKEQSLYLELEIKKKVLKINTILILLLSSYCSVCIPINVDPNYITISNAEKGSTLLSFSVCIQGNASVQTTEKEAIKSHA